MIIPPGPEGSPAAGKPTLHTSHIRAYGAGSMLLVDQESELGCPRQYRLRYVDKTAAAFKQSDFLDYGTVIHAVLALMEEETLGPEDALRRVWIPTLDESWWAQAVEDLDNYLARGAPSSHLGTIAVEQELYGLLYVDEVFGEVWFGGKLDWLGIDVNEPETLHVVDYKTDRRPRARASLKGDVQLRSYDWLVRQNWSMYMTSARPSVVVHVDLIKHYDLEWWYEEQEIEEWAAWAEAIARRILRDDAGDPVTGPGCGWCPVKLDCWKYKALPGQGKGLLERRNTTDLVRLLDWKAEAAETIRVLRNGIDDIDKVLAERVDVEGGAVLLGDVLYSRVDAMTKQADLRRVHAVLGSRFYDIASLSLKALDDVSRGDPQLRDKLQACVEQVLTGTKITKKKAEE